MSGIEALTIQSGGPLGPEGACSMEPNLSLSLNPHDKLAAVMAWFPQAGMARSSLELAGRLTLAQVDVAQRLNYLAAHLCLGVADALGHSQLVQGEDFLSRADRAAAQQKAVRVLEAGAEGCACIVQAYLDEVTAAFGASAQLGLSLQLPDALALPAPGSRWHIPGFDGARAFSAAGSRRAAS